MSDERLMLEISEALKKAGINNTPVGDAVEVHILLDELTPGTVQTLHLKSRPYQKINS